MKPLTTFLNRSNKIWKPQAIKFRNGAQKLLHRALQLHPIEPQTVFFESHRGDSYSGNPKAICEAIVARGLPIQCVWSLHDTKAQVPKGVKKVKTGSYDYYYYHACAKVLIHNTEFRQNLPIRSEQVYINTQHGTPLKLMGSDMVDRNPNIEGQGKRWNYYPKNGRWTHLVSPNRHTTEVFRRVFQFDGSVLEYGYPRNDLFYTRNTPGEIRSLKIRLGIPLDRKVILYAPTWRNNGASRKDAKFQLRLELDSLQREFGETHVVILRLHHLIVASLRIDPQMRDFVFERSSSKYDAQELMLAADVLITDYSSMLFDYCNLRRPIIFFAYDIEEYSSKTRGMYFDLREKAPGPVVTEMQGVLEALRTIDSWRALYAEREAAFYAEYCSLDDGHAADKLIDNIIAPACGF